MERVRACFDTSFFVQLLGGNPEAVEVWKKVAELEIEPVISVIVLFELKRLALKGKIEKEKYDQLEKALMEIADLVELDTGLSLKAASVSHGTGLAARDAIIYTTALESGCSELYTADSDFEAVKQSGKVKILIVSS